MKNILNIFFPSILLILPGKAWTTTCTTDLQVLRKLRFDLTPFDAETFKDAYLELIQELSAEHLKVLLKNDGFDLGIGIPTELRPIQSGLQQLKELLGDIVFSPKRILQNFLDSERSSSSQQDSTNREVEGTHPLTRIIAKPLLHDESIYPLKDGSWFIQASEGVFDPHSGTLFSDSYLGDSTIISPTGTLIAGIVRQEEKADRDIVQIKKLDKTAQCFLTPSHKYIYKIKFSEDDKSIIILGAGKDDETPGLCLEIFDIETGEPAATIKENDLPRFPIEASGKRPLAKSDLYLLRQDATIFEVENNRIYVLRWHYPDLLIWEINMKNSSYRPIRSQSFKMLGLSGFDISRNGQWAILSFADSPDYILLSLTNLDLPPLRIEPPRSSSRFGHTKFKLSQNGRFLAKIVSNHKLWIFDVQEYLKQIYELEIDFGEEAFTP